MTNDNKALIRRWFDEVWTNAAYRDAFPDVRITVEDVVAEGDRVAARWSATATDKGNALGMRQQLGAVSQPR